MLGQWYCQLYEVWKLLWICAGQISPSMTPYLWWLEDVASMQPCGTGMVSLLVWQQTNACKTPYPPGAASLSALSQSSVIWCLPTTCQDSPRTRWILCKVCHSSFRKKFWKLCLCSYSSIYIQSHCITKLWFFIFFRIGFQYAKITK